MTDDIVGQPATKDIRFHARLIRLSDCIAGDPNIDEDLWAVPLAALAEIERLRRLGDTLAHHVRAEEAKEMYSAVYAWEEARRD